MKTRHNRQNEQGNALFLILIAVVLFAALSYAITQSNRGGGAPNRETSLIASTTVTQYSSAMRTGITRMLLRNTAISDLSFTAPVDTNFSTETPTSEMVFHPEGGGVSYAPVDVNTVNNTPSTTFNDRQNSNWYFVETPVEGVGTDEVDLVAMLDDVKEAICQRINEQITGVKDIPAMSAAAAAILADSASEVIAGGVAPSSVNGQSFMCVESSDGRFIYYQVLAEQ